MTLNTRSPDHRSNFPVGYNDWSNDYQLNQLWLHAGRQVDTGGCGWDVGGRVDVVFGTDARFFTAQGLEDRVNHEDSPYQVALPQVYAEAAYNDVSIQLGHFWSPFGYEQAPAPENFFYSHALSFVRAQPRTFTGLMGRWRPTERLGLLAGVHRGWNNWEDENDALGFVGGGSWENPDWGTRLAVLVSTSPEGDQIIGPAFDANVTAVEVVLSQRITEKLTYAIEHTNTRATTTGEFVARRGLRVDDHVYGVNQYLLYG